MSLPREGARVTRDGIVTSVPMNWGRSPQAIVPYRVHTQGQIEGASAAGTVRQTDQASYVEGSRIKACYGDEAATGGGVRFGTQGAECAPKTWSKTVKIQDQGVVRHDDEWWMNHGETWGKLTYVKDTNIYEISEERQIKSVMPPFGSDHEPRTQVAQAPIAIGAPAGMAEPGIALSGAGAFLEAAPPVAAGTAAIIGIGGVGLGAGALTAIGHNSFITILAGPDISAPVNPNLDDLDQIYYNKQSQNLAAAKVKPASWVRVTSAHPCAAFACPPAKGLYGGGSYACIKNRQRSKSDGSRNTPHHTPSAAASYLPYSAGPVIKMSPSDHALTASYQNTAASMLYIRAQEALISSGKFLDSTMMDIADISIKFPDGRYKDAIAQMVAYTTCLKANEFVK